MLNEFYLNNRLIITILLGWKIKTILTYNFSVANKRREGEFPYSSGVERGERGRNREITQSGLVKT